MPAFCCFANRAWREDSHFGGAGWSSPVARQAHNLKVVGSNPTPATNKKARFPYGVAGFFVSGAG